MGEYASVIVGGMFGGRVCGSRHVYQKNGHCFAKVTKIVSHPAESWASMGRIKKKVAKPYWCVPCSSSVYHVSALQICATGLCWVSVGDRARCVASSSCCSMQGNACNRRNDASTDKFARALSFALSILPPLLARSTSLPSLPQPLYPFSIWGCAAGTVARTERSTTKLF